MFQMLFFIYFMLPNKNYSINKYNFIFIFILIFVLLKSIIFLYNIYLYGGGFGADNIAFN